MHLKIPTSVNTLIKNTKFWQNNYLFLREFKYFPKVVMLALVFSVIAATFEGLSIGFLLCFLQSLTIQTRNRFRQELAGLTLGF